MDRLTKKLNQNGYYVSERAIWHDENGYFGEAVSKLAKFEDIYDELTARQGEITKELEKLRAEGKTNSVKVKQLLAEKSTNNNILIIFEMHGPK